MENKRKPLELTYLPTGQKIYFRGLGEWGVTDGMVFENRSVEDLTDLIPTFANVYHGLDFGVEDPNALICFDFEAGQKKIYIFDEFYEGHFTLDALANEVKKKRGNRYVTCDAAGKQNIDFKVGCFAGKPIAYSYSSTEEAVQETGSEEAISEASKAITDFVVRNNMPDVAMEITKYAAIAGYAGRLFYIDTEGNERTVTLLPYETIVLSEMEVTEPKYAIRYYKTTDIHDKSVWKAEFYDSRDIYYYEGNLSDLAFVKREPHLFDYCPLQIIPNNKEMLGDAEKVLNDTFTENNLARMEENIYRFSKTPNLSDESFGSASGIALKFKLTGLETKCGMFQAKMQAAGMYMFKVLASSRGKRKITVDPLRCIMDFKRNFPPDILSEAQAAQQLIAAGLPKRVAYTLALSGVDDIDRVMQLIEQETNGIPDLPDLPEDEVD